MNASDQLRDVAKSIFFKVVELEDAGERGAFLDQECPDADVRRNVEALLSAHESGRGKLVSLAAERLNGRISAEELVADESPTASLVNIDASTHPVIDRYKLLEEIGRGGMGTVYMAQQLEPVKRRVALKVINPGMDSREVIARFEAERQALAMMDHPNIARVFDGGTTAEGRPYFVMELVRGVPITEYCDRHDLVLDDRLRLFIDVCRAVQHAHQKGIIHRDLKPSNVQVTHDDGNPIVKVIDFGVAKALNHDLTDRTLFTQFSQMVGTPLYMSPEQADRHGFDVDTRSDVYSLGVMLYELLTGTTPFDRNELSSAGIDGVRRMICEVDPPRPSIRTSTLEAADDSTLKASKKQTPRTRQGRLALRGDLDWIVMKALEKHRSYRYESASALAQDIQRHLVNEPIEAKPPTLSTRVAKWARRHAPVAWLLTAFILLATASLAAWAGWQAAYQAALSGEVQQYLQQATTAIDSDDVPLALELLAVGRKTASQLGNEDDPLLERIEQLTKEMHRHAEFTTHYNDSRRNRYDEEEPLKALSLYGLPKDREWLNRLKELQLPESHVERLLPKIYQLLVQLAHMEVFGMDSTATNEGEKLEAISNARSLLRTADQIHAPTKGYYWSLANCYQRLGDLTEGEVRAHHDAEALRLRKLADATAPLDATDLFIIFKDHWYGSADGGERKPFADPLTDEEFLALFREMMRIDPTYYNGLFYHGIWLHKMGRHAEAAQAFTGCLVAWPEDYGALTNRGLSLVRAGHAAEGLRDQEAAIAYARKGNPSPRRTKVVADLLREYAESLHFAGRTDDARTALEDAIKLVDETENANSLTAEQENDLGEIKASAVALLEKLASESQD